MAEKDIVNAILRYLKAVPACFAWKTHGGMYGTAGIPDIIACIGGRFVAFEVKTPSGKMIPVCRLNPDNEEQGLSSSRDGVWGDSWGRQCLTWSVCTAMCRRACSCGASGACAWCAHRARKQEPSAARALGGVDMARTDCFSSCRCFPGRQTQLRRCRS